MARAKHQLSYEELEKRLAEAQEKIESWKAKTKTGKRKTRL